MPKKPAKSKEAPVSSEKQVEELKYSPMEESVKKEAVVQEDEFTRMSAQMPKEAQEKLKILKEKLDKFKDKALEKFDKYIMGIALLPPPRPQQPGVPAVPMPPPVQGAPPQAPPDPNRISLLVLIDDSDSKKMSKQELGSKLAGILATIAKEIDSNMVPDVILLSELWQNLYDAKYDLLQLIAMSASVFDRGMLAAVKIAEVHKTMVLKKFERYIVSYVLAGSLVQGRATEKSDIDVFIVIDDTDVKRMTRVELKDKLRAIIIGMGIEAGEITGVRNKINIQVYILTDFWDSIREANPIIFTFLRDGVPLYDRGIFMPWKQLLRIGKIKPSPEAIELYMSTGDQVIKRVKFKLKEIGMEDTFWAILTPSQAALMMYGIPPPTPKETPEVMREIFVKREKLLEDEFVDILERCIKLRKDLEHGDKKELSGKEVDGMLEDCERYLKRLDKLFSEIELKKQHEGVDAVFDALESTMRDLLRIEGIEKIPESSLVKVFEEEFVKSGKVSVSIFKSLKAALKSREQSKDGKIVKAELEKFRKEGEGVLRYLIEYTQRKRAFEMSKSRLRVRANGKYGEVVVLAESAFIIKNVDSDKKEVFLAKISASGELMNLIPSSIEDMDKTIESHAVPPKGYIKEKLFESLKSVFGADVEILLNH